MGRSPVFFMLTRMADLAESTWTSAMFAERTVDGPNWAVAREQSPRKSDNTVRQVRIGPPEYQSTFLKGCKEGVANTVLRFRSQWNCAKITRYGLRGYEEE